MKIIIQPRDIQIMKFVFACRVVSYDQIIRRHFFKANYVVGYRRTRKLISAGYFKSGVFEVHGKVIRIVRPLPKLWPLIHEKWPVQVDTPYFKSESIEHDVRLAELFLRLEKLNCFRSFYTENLLQSSLALAQDPRFKSLVRLQADGALNIIDNNGVLKIYGVEYELSKKSPEGYRQKLIDYYLAKGLDGVLYISPKREVETLLSRAQIEISKDHDGFVWFVSEENALKPCGKIIFQNQNGQILELS